MKKIIEHKKNMRLFLSPRYDRGFRNHKRHRVKTDEFKLATLEISLP